MPDELERVRRAVAAEMSNGTYTSESLARAALAASSQPVSGGDHEFEKWEDDVERVAQAAYEVFRHHQPALNAWEDADPEVCRRHLEAAVAAIAALKARGSGGPEGDVEAAIRRKLRSIPQDVFAAVAKGDREAEQRIVRVAAQAALSRVPAAGERDESHPQRLGWDR